MPDSSFHRILVATDFSTHSQAAASAAREIAETVSATSLTYATVLRTSPAHLDQWFYNEWALRAVKVKAEGKAGKQLYEIPAAEDPTITFREQPHGVPAHEIMRLSTDADLLVMGTHGRGGVGRFFLGSVAFATLGKVRCPTLLVGAHMHFKKPRSVLAAIDFSARAKRVAQTADEFAAAFGGRLELFHAFEGPQALLEGEELPPELFPADTEKVCGERTERLRELLPDPKSPMKVVAEVSVTAPPEAVAQHVKKATPSVLVLGAQGHSEMFGSTLARVFAESACPILVVP